MDNDIPDRSKALDKNMHAMLKIELRGQCYQKTTFDFNSITIQ